MLEVFAKLQINVFIDFFSHVSPNRLETVLRLSHVVGHFAQSYTTLKVIIVRDVRSTNLADSPFTVIFGTFV